MWGSSSSGENRKEEEEGEVEAVIIGGMVLDIQATSSIPPNPRTTSPGKVCYAVGGVARNIAECVSKLGTKPCMISTLGLDMAGNLLLEYWKSAGLSTEGIRMGQEIDTPVVCIVFDTYGEPAAAVASVESVERFLTPKWIAQFKSNIASTPIVMVDANLSPAALQASCELAAEFGTPVWFEPVSVAKSRRIVSVANALRLEGSSSSSSPYVVHFPAVSSASVVRVTGAGDCLVGGAVASICAGLDVMQSIAVGIAAAKAAVEAETNVPTEYSLEQIAEACNLFDEMPDRNVFTWNAIISAHIKSHNLAKAQGLFDAAPHRDSVTYNSMLSGYANSDGYEKPAIDFFMQMHSVGYDGLIDEFSLTRMCNLTAKLRNSRHAKQLHSFMVKTGNNLSGFAVSALVDMYSKCGCFSEAYEAFNGCYSGSVDVVSKNAVVAACCREGRLDMAMELFSTQPEFNDVVSWNTMITGYAQNGCGKDAIELAVCMANNGFRWNEHTFASVLSACSSLKSLKLGKELHARILKEITSLNPFISSGIVDVYCKCGNMKYAESANSLIGTENKFATTSMIVGYSSQHNMKEARRIFDSLTVKNPVVWSAMFSGYLHSHCIEDVFELFRLFNTEETTVPDGSILASFLGACAIQATMDLGKQVHSYLFRMNIHMDEKTISALIDMYSKCGNIMYGKRIFERLTFRDSVIYNIMIAGFAHHGYELEAFQLFDNMVRSGFTPDTVTFIAILSACRHCGLVETGESYFMSMIEEYKITPEMDHYACMIDLYGRANQLEKAMEFMRKIPRELDVVVVRTFLNACKLHRNLEIARESEEKLLRIGGDSVTRYVQLANIYASEGEWEEMGRIRKKMRSNEVSKVAGCSWVHVGSNVHSFTSGDTYHSEAEATYGILDLLIAEMNNKEEMQLCPRFPSNVDPRVKYAERGNRFQIPYSCYRFLMQVGLRLLLCPLGSNIVVRTACCSVGVVLPVYSTFKAIETNNQDDQQKWLLYWAAYGTFSVAEIFADRIIYWFPLYHHMKFAFLVWLQLPTTNGAKQLYMSHLRPFLLRHQANLDQLVGILYSETVKPLSLFKCLKLGASKHLVNNSSQPVPPPEGRTITGQREQVESSNSDDSNDDDDDDFVAFPDSF
ncbi:Carbohydrate kinase PfkB [Cynara cardunculus var. scolymus]|uniref:Carbohydrate kinase PfkB n=1 Tax=Cynara cardunculus var. scolymus TaxID=59895 RepID=A0A103YKJ5_CYNCS|nr:Carbohydrate kinase PfkB [Cynara cardunculus var. scolymus]